MTDFTTIIPAELLPDAVREYTAVFNNLASQGMGLHNLGDEVWETLDQADAAFRAALDLVASLMVCGTCKSLRDEDHYCELAQHRHPMLHEERCQFTPSRWQHYEEAVS